MHLSVIVLDMVLVGIFFKYLRIVTIWQITKSCLHSSGMYVMMC
jgi:hypothetical protein